MKIEICDELKELNKQFKKLGKKLFVVGGYVRDYLLGNISEDIDIASSFSPEEIVKNIKGFEINIVNKKLGTVHIKKNNKVFEHTAFRVDYYHDNGEHSPYMVEFCNDEKTDSFRRDFSVNSIYYDIQNNELIDYFEGIEDIKNRQIKAIVSPEYVFGSDGIRILRLVRFSTFLKFDIENDTLLGAKEFSYQLNDITPSRIYDELNKILSYDNFLKGIEILKKIGAFEYIFRLSDLSLKKNIYDVFNSDFLVYLNENTPKNERMEMLCLDVIFTLKKYLNDESISLGQISEFLLDSKYFSLGKKKDEKIINILSSLEELENSIENNSIKAMILDLYEDIDLVLNICKNTPNFCEFVDIYEKLKQKNIALSLDEFCIKSNDIINKNLTGKNISLALNDLLLYSVIYEINDKELLLKVLDQLIKENKYE